MPLRRRDLLKSALLVPAASVLGANDRIRLGVIGCGNRGAYMMGEFQKFPEIQVAAVCDVFGEKTDRAGESAAGAEKFADYRRLIERRDIDAVLVTLGQVPWRPWNPHQYHHYRLFLDFGGAAMTDLFTHWIDVVHMLVGQDTPRSVAAMGGIFVAKDDRTAPDTANVAARYDGFTVTFESASLPGLPIEHAVFNGTKGRLWMTRQRYEFTPNEPGAKPVTYEPPDNMVESHIRNFLECCRSRKRPNCEPHHGDRAAQACLRATEAYRQNSRLKQRAGDAGAGCPAV